MRRLLVVLFVLAAAGCSGAEEAPPPPAAGPTSASAAAVSPSAAPSATTGGNPDKALSGNTKAICEQATRVSTQFAATFAQDLKLLIDAASSSDPGASRQAEQKTTRDVQSYSFALNDMAKLVDDPAVKKALAEMGKQVTALKGDVSKIDAKKLEAISGTLDEACGTA